MNSKRHENGRGIKRRIKIYFQYAHRILIKHLPRIKLPESLDRSPVVQIENKREKMLIMLMSVERKRWKRTAGGFKFVICRHKLHINTVGWKRLSGVIIIYEGNLRGRSGS